MPARMLTCKPQDGGRSGAEGHSFPLLSPAESSLLQETALMKFRRNPFPQPGVRRQLCLVNQIHNQPGAPGQSNPGVWLPQRQHWLTSPCLSFTSCAQQIRPRRQNECLAAREPKWRESGGGAPRSWGGGRPQAHRELLFLKHPEDNCSFVYQTLSLPSIFF